MKKLLVTLLFAALAATQAAPALASAREEARLIEASGVLEELFAQRDTAIPERLMARAYGIAVIPNVVKVAAVVGGRRGSGAMVVRDANGRFSDPIMVSLTGGNVGWQIGVQSTDIVLVFTTAQGHRGHRRRQAHAGCRRLGGRGPRGTRGLGRPRIRTSRPRCTRTRAIAGCSPASRSTAASSPSTASRTTGCTARRAPASDIIARHGSPPTWTRPSDSSAPSSPAPPVMRSARPAPAMRRPRTDTRRRTGHGRARGRAPGRRTTFPMEDSQPGAEPPR